MFRVAFTAGIACIALAGCASTRPVVPMGAEAYRTFPSSTQIPAVSEYRIGAFDVISISTFQEEGLTLEEVKVDSGGGIIFPLIGPVQAAGRTAVLTSEDAWPQGRYLAIDLQIGSQLLGAEISEAELDRPLRDLGDPSKVEGHQSRFQVVTELARRDNLTVRASDLGETPQIVVLEPKRLSAGQ